MYCLVHKLFRCSKGTWEITDLFADEFLVNLCLLTYTDGFTSHSDVQKLLIDYGCLFPLITCTKVCKISPVYQGCNHRLATFVFQAEVIKNWQITIVCHLASDWGKRMALLWQLAHIDKGRAEKRSQEKQIRGGDLITQHRDLKEWCQMEMAGRWNKKEAIRWETCVPIFGNKARTAIAQVQHHSA